MPVEVEIIEKLRSKKKVAKSAITRNVNRVRELINNKESVSKVRQYAKNIEEAREKARIVINELEKADPSSIEADGEWLVEVECDVTDALGEIADYLQESSQTEPQNPSISNEEQSSSENSTVISGNSRSSGLKGVKIPVFDGSPEKWPYFWGIFSSLVDNNKSLSDAIKLAHLNNSINDRVREVIACLTGEPGDYQKAVKLLSDRYGDPREVVDAHLHRITNWHNIKEKDRDAFERFADALQAAVFALDKPDYRHELSSMPLCTQLVRKLPPSEKDEWVRQIERKQVTENVKGLAEYAQLRVKLLRKRDRYNTPAPPKEDPKFNPKFAHKRAYLAKHRLGNVLYAMGFKVKGKSTVHTVGGVRTTLKSQRVRVPFAPAVTDIDVYAWTMKNICEPVQSVDWTEIKKQYEHLRDVPVMSAGETAVDVLLGLDAASLMAPLEVRAEKHDGEEDANHQWRKLWEIDSFGVRVEATTYTCSEQRAVDIMNETCRRVESGYELGLLWKADRPPLPNNFKSALSRLESVERLLQKDPKLADGYCKAINAYVEKGFAQKLSPEEFAMDGEQWLLPHHPVINSHKPLPRVVFDSAAKHDGVCLNDCLETGPSLHNDLPGILLRFRERPIALVGDVSDMFCHVLVKEEDRKYHRYLWRDMDSTRPPDVYEMNCLVFGDKSSPCEVNFAVIRTTEDNQDQWPEAVATVRRDIFVDDFYSSCNDVPQAVSLRADVSSLMAKGGFPMRKWLSSSPEVLATIPETERSISNENLHQGELPTGRALGVRGLDWDEPLPADIASEWVKWESEVAALKAFAVPRYIYSLSSKTLTRELVVFCDASEDACAAVAYMRAVLVDCEVIYHLVMAKTRLMPLKTISIPRGELMGCQLAVRLAKTICEQLGLSMLHVRYLSDSTTAIWWIHGELRNFQPFVANRVAEVISESDPGQWHHVRTDLNVADIATRRVAANDLKPESRWIDGPDFLKSDKSEWPIDDIPGPPSPTAQREMKKKVLGAKVVVTKLLDPSSYFNWLKLVRVTAWILRFCHNLRKKDRRNAEVLSVEELEEAELYWIKSAQQDRFGVEVESLSKGRPAAQASRIADLNPQLVNGILRVGGRIDKAELPWKAKHPIILDHV
ncbi:Hypothetical predicted protein [Paramuricea clavata]|uniref:Uncharacterized protein n=1 Tax=Paramuricea clavata TaxID=317549 RepID=A0A6S7IXJ8_PARCT|nr:Hypothetical predicted protein [Paramuricea clavata]